MKSIRYPILLALVACVATGAFTTKAKAQNSKKPNVVLIVVDDMGWGDPG